MIIQNGDHMQFEIDNANVPPKERPDWPMPSFDARDWAQAFCKIAADKGLQIDEGWMITWFAAALMRGFDEHASRSRTSQSDEKDCACPGGQAEHLNSCVYCR
jgi:hypothetical protein